MHGEEAGDLLDAPGDIAGQVLVDQLALFLLLQHLSQVLRVNSEFVNAVHLPKWVRGVLQIT